MNMKKRFGTKGERGQSFVELAISLLFLMVLLSTVIDLGWAYYTIIALRDVAQEAASYGAMCPEDANLTTKVKNRLIQSATAPISMADLASGNIEICRVGPDKSTWPAPFSCTTNAAVSTDNNIRVTVRIQHKIMTPFVGTFIGTQTYPLTATVANKILVTECAVTN
jgi:Flp pilus assembly protein TadG